MLNRPFRSFTRELSFLLKRATESVTVVETSAE